MQSKYLINGKPYKSITKIIENETPYTYAQYGRFKNKTGISINSQDSFEKFLKWMESQSPKEHPTVKIFYDGVEHRSLRKLCAHLGVTPAQYVAYRKASGKHIRKTEDVQDFLDYLSKDMRKSEFRSKPRTNGERNVVFIRNQKFLTIGEYIESKTPYTYKDYKYFKSKTGITVNSDEALDQFLEFTEKLYEKRRKYNRI